MSLLLAKSQLLGYLVKDLAPEQKSHSRKRSYFNVDFRVGDRRCFLGSFLTFLFLLLQVLARPSISALGLPHVR